MKIAILACLCLNLALLATPEEDMGSLLDALYRVDGETVFRSLTRENQEAISMMVSMFRLAPEEVAAELRQELQAQVSSSEIMCMREEDLVRIIIDSPGFREHIPYSRDMISLEIGEMCGDTAFVKVVIEGEAETWDYPMVMQDGSWKLATPFFSDR